MTDSNPHPSTFEEDKLLVDCRVQRTRASGPGGQHRNKVETAIVITHLPTGITGQASERRSQHDNHRVAIARLRINLALGVRREIGDVQQFEVSDLWRKRTVKGRITVSVEHEDFPAILAEALDILAVCDHDAGRAAVVLDCSSSQLIKLLRKEPAAIRQLNRRRQEIGLSVYR